MTGTVAGTLFIGSFALDWFAPRIAGRRWLSLLLFVASAVAWWTGVALPIGREAAWYLDLATLAAVAVLMVACAPRFLREIKAAARE